MRFDYFIHTDAATETERQTEPFAVYRKNILHAADNADNAISISADPEVENIVPPKARFQSIQYKSGIQTGRITRETSEKLLSLLGHDPLSHEHRIHGLYVAQCTAQFAVQLHALLQYGEYFPDYPPVPPWKPDPHWRKREGQLQRMLDMVRAGELFQSPIKYGVVFVAKEDPPQLCPDAYYLQDQLRDDQTRVF